MMQTAVSRMSQLGRCPQGGQQGQNCARDQGSQPRLSLLLVVMPALQARQLPLFLLVAPLQFCQLHAHLYFLCIQPVDGSLQGTHLCASVQELERCNQASGWCGRRPRHAEEFPPVAALGSVCQHAHLRAWF